MATAGLVGAAGAGLLLANEWAGPNRGVLGGILWDKGADPAEAHAALKRLAGELLFLTVLVLLAGIGGGWATATLAAIAALWVLWLINRNKGG